MGLPASRRQGVKKYDNKCFIELKFKIYFLFLKKILRIKLRRYNFQKEEIVK